MQKKYIHFFHVFCNICKQVEQKLAFQLHASGVRQPEKLAKPFLIKSFTVLRCEKYNQSRNASKLTWNMDSFDSFLNVTTLKAKFSLFM